MSKDNNNNNNDNDKSKLPVLLCNGRYVDPDILDIVRMYVETRIPVLSPDIALTLRQIIGEDNWDDLNKINKIEAGYCMVHLVEIGEVPFIAVEGRHEYPKLYQLNSTKLGTRIP